MNDQKAKAHDLFLLMFTLSQMTVEQKIVDVFIGALKEIWPDTPIAYQPLKTNEYNIIEIAVSNGNYGFIKIDKLADLQTDEQGLLHNAVAMLAVILKKNEQDQLLADEKLHLRKRIDEATMALKESEEKFRNVFEYSIVGKSITTIDGKLETNEAFSRILGYSNAELSTLKWQEITHSEDVEKNEEIVNSIISGKQASARWEKRYLHKNGNVVWVDISTTLHRDHHAKPLYFITSINDITNRKQAEEAIRKLNENLEQKVTERTIELRKTIAKLEELNRVFVGRELRMMELKARIAELEGKK